MGRFLVIGALAWDRPVWLSGPLASGARLGGRTLDGTLGGRLGGGGANAGLALRAAGHEVAVFAAVAADPDGDQIVASAQAGGLELTGVARPPGESGRTLILIEPGGERLILGLDPPRLAGPPRAEAWLEALAAARARLAGWVADGVYVRAPYPGAVALAGACGGPVVTHWPTDGASLAAAQVLVGSTDDLGAAAAAAPLAAARAAGAARAVWAVITDGANPVRAESAGQMLSCAPPPAEVRDATGAGDIFAAGLLEALAAGADMAAALAHGCAWGAVAVGLDGGAPLGAGPAQFPPFPGRPATPA